MGSSLTLDFRRHLRLLHLLRVHGRLLHDLRRYLLLLNVAYGRSRRHDYSDGIMASNRSTTERQTSRKRNWGGNCNNEGYVCFHAKASVHALETERDSLVDTRERRCWKCNKKIKSVLRANNLLSP